MTFEEELKSLEGKKTIEEVSAYKIGLYLCDRAQQDPSVARNIEKEKKSLMECYQYVKKEVGKLVKKEPIVMMDDEPVYNMAIHYYDEDDIKVKNDEATIAHEAIKKPVAVSAKQEVVKPVNIRKKKNDAPDGQLTLF